MSAMHGIGCFCLTLAMSTSPAGKEFAPPAALDRNPILAIAAEPPSIGLD